MNKHRICLVGARGYVGRELTTLISQHDGLELQLAVSQRDERTPESIAAEAADAYILALPNGVSEPYIRAISAVRPDAVILDLSADHRFDASWIYGQPERNRAQIREARHISNPGCYATAMQLALAPVVDCIEGPANVFGVSGYSGAGTRPSQKNDPEVLRDNLMPYALVGHVHEREVASQLGCRLFFVPHVAPFFRGITVTLSLNLKKPSTHANLLNRYQMAYDSEPLVEVQESPPLVRDIVGRHGVIIGGLTVSEDGHHAVLIATIDNLLGGAATQALRNLNLALGFNENHSLTI